MISDFLNKMQNNIQLLDSSGKIFIALLGGYFVASIVLLKNPALIHRRRKVNFICRHISHRGGAGEGYENTIGAFKRAVSLGTDMLELDCQITKDNQVVVSHDNNLLRCTGHNMLISETEYKDLPLLKKDIPVDFDPGVIFEGSGNEDERKIPLLAEVFRLFPTVPINIDIKANNDCLIKEVDRLIGQYDREGITVWGNFGEEITRKCYNQNPNINLLFSLKSVVRLIALFYTGLLPFVPLKETHLEIFMPSMYCQEAWVKNKKKETVPSFVAICPPRVVDTLDKLVMRKSLFQHLNKRGIQTYIWVLNHESEFKKAFDHGVTGIMTDYPSRLSEFLKENPQYRLDKSQCLHT